MEAFKLQAAGGMNLKATDGDAKVLIAARDDW